MAASSCLTLTISSGSSRTAPGGKVTSPRTTVDFDQWSNAPSRVAHHGHPPTGPIPRHREEPTRTLDAGRHNQLAPIGQPRTLARRNLETHRHPRTSEQVQGVNRGNTY